MSKSGQVTVTGLAWLRSDLNMSKDKYKMAQAKVLLTEQTAYICEDLVEAKRTGRLFWSLRNKGGTDNDYRWYVLYKPWLYRIGALIGYILSFFSFLGVVCSMQGVPNLTSPYFLAVHNAYTAAGVVIFILLSLGYTTYVTLWSVFLIKIPGFVELVPFRTSPEYLSFNTRMCLRLAPPIIFFYLGWIAENGIKSGSWTDWVSTSNVNQSSIGQNNTIVYFVGPVTTNKPMLSGFSRFYNIQAIPVMTQLYGTGYPVLLFILLPLFALNIFNRLLILFKLSAYQFGTGEDSSSVFLLFLCIIMLTVSFSFEYHTSDPQRRALGGGQEAARQVQEDSGKRLFLLLSSVISYFSLYLPLRMCV